MTQELITEIANLIHVKALSGQLKNSNSAFDVALKISKTVPLEILIDEGYESCWDVANALRLSPKETWELNEEIKYLNLEGIIKRRKAQEVRNDS